MTDDDFHRAIRYVTVIFRGLFVLVATFAFVAAAGTYFINSLPTTYTATSMIEIMPGPASGAWPGSVRPPAVEPSELDADVKAIPSPEVLGNVISDMDLDAAWAVRVFNSKDRLSKDEALAYLQSILKSQLIPGTNVVQISASSALPSEAAEISNEVAESYQRVKGASVRLLQRAKVPRYASWPNRRVYLTVTYIIAALLSIGVASSVEVVYLLIRASERPES